MKFRKLGIRVSFNLKEAEFLRIMLTYILGPIKSSNKKKSGVEYIYDGVNTYAREFHKCFCYTCRFTHLVRFFFTVYSFGLTDYSISSILLLLFLGQFFVCFFSSFLMV